MARAAIMDGLPLAVDEDGRVEPPTCRTCECCAVAPWPHGAGANGIGWCIPGEDWVDGLDEPRACSEWTPGHNADVDAPSLRQLAGRRVYLSGPMAGVDDPRLAFGPVAERLRDAGAFVWDPSELSGMSWFPFPEWSLPMREQAMDEDLHELTRQTATGPYYDALVLLPGWESSRGARLEREVAAACGIPAVLACDIGGLL